MEKTNEVTGVANRYQLETVFKKEIKDQFNNLIQPWVKREIEKADKRAELNNNDDDDTADTDPDYGNGYDYYDDDDNDDENKNDEDVSPFSHTMLKEWALFVIDIDNINLLNKYFHHTHTDQILRNISACISTFTKLYCSDNPVSYYRFWVFHQHSDSFVLLVNYAKENAQKNEIEEKAKQQNLDKPKNSRSGNGSNDAGGGGISGIGYGGGNGFGNGFNHDGSGGGSGGGMKTNDMSGKNGGSTSLDHNEYLAERFGSRIRNDNFEFDNNWVTTLGNELTNFINTYCNSKDRMLRFVPGFVRDDDSNFLNANYRVTVSVGAALLESIVVKPQFVQDDDDEKKRNDRDNNYDNNYNYNNNSNNNDENDENKDLDKKKFFRQELNKRVGFDFGFFDKYSLSLCDWIDKAEQEMHKAKWNKYLNTHTKRKKLYEQARISRFVGKDDNAFFSDMESDDEYDDDDNDADNNNNNDDDDGKSGGKVKRQGKGKGNGKDDTDEKKNSNNGDDNIHHNRERTLSVYGGRSRPPSLTHSYSFIMAKSKDPPANSPLFDRTSHGQTKEFFDNIQKDKKFRFDAYPTSKFQLARSINSGNRGMSDEEIKFRVQHMIRQYENEDPWVGWADQLYHLLRLGVVDVNLTDRLYKEDVKASESENDGNNINESKTHKKHKKSKKKKKKKNGNDITGNTAFMFGLRSIDRKQDSDNGNDGNKGGKGGKDGKRSKKKRKFNGLRCQHTCNLLSIQPSMDVNLQNRNAQTPLMMAISVFDKVPSLTYNLLIHHWNQIDWNLRDTNGLSVLDYALDTKYNAFNVALIFIESNIAKECIMTQFKMESTEEYYKQLKIYYQIASNKYESKENPHDTSNLISHFIEYGQHENDLNCVSKMKIHPNFFCAKYKLRSALHQAAATSQADICKYLLSGKINANLCAIDEMNSTPLHMCAWEGDVKTLTILLKSSKHGPHCDHFDINCVNLLGWTPLLMLCKREYVKENSKNNSDNRPKVNASTNGNSARFDVEMIKLMLDYGANPLFKAKREEKQDSIEIIEDRMVKLTDKNSEEHEALEKALKILKEYKEKNNNVYKTQIALYKTKETRRSGIMSTQQIDALKLRNNRKNENDDDNSKISGINDNVTTKKNVA